MHLTAWATPTPPRQTFGWHLSFATIAACIRPTSRKPGYCEKRAEGTTLPQTPGNLNKDCAPKMARALMLLNGRSHFESAGLIVKITSNKIGERSGSGGDLSAHGKQGVDADTLTQSLGEQIDQTPLGDVILNKKIRQK